MARGTTETVGRQLVSLFDGGSVAGLTDRQLLERYTSQGAGEAGEAAFAALVERHGPMVLGLCRQLLGDVHQAEDSFQAVFLVLARRARSIRDPDRLGNWLYGVAVRTARCARRQNTRRRMREEGDAMNGPGPGAIASAEATAPPADRPAIDREQAEALHGEIARLPRTFRLPVVLCYFEGLSLDEAAHRLRCPAGTLRSRIARAREKLRQGLARRGVIVPAAALGALLESRSASASVSPLLCETTTRAATAFAARHAASGALSATAAALAREVLRTMLVHKLRLSALSLLLISVVATGAGWLTQTLAMKDEPKPEPAAKVAAQDPDRMTVAGRVLDPDGKAVAGAVVEVVARKRSPWVGASESEEWHTLLGQARSGADGRYQLDSPRTASNRVFEVIALAAAPGFGLGWAELNPDAESPSADLILRPEESVRLRLVDVTGIPVPGLEVRVIGTLGTRDNRGLNDQAGLYWEKPPEGVRTWPGPFVTDDQGRITLRGFGRGDGLSLGVRDLRFARQDLHVGQARASADRVTTLTLEPARIIEGRVLAADTGRPIPHAVISTSTRVHNEHANGIMTAKFRADGEGRFKVNPIVGTKYTLGAFPTGGEPYLIQQDEIPLAKGQTQVVHDIKVLRGVLIRGKITEAGSGRPLPASSIQFIPARSRGNDAILSGWRAMVASDDEGVFQIAVPAGKGHLLVFGPTGDYVLETIGSNRLYNGGPGGMRYHGHAIIPYEVKAGDPPLDVAASLRPATTVKVRVEGPQGEPVPSGLVITTLHVEAFNPYWRGDFQLDLRDGRVEVHGVPPDSRTPSRIHILDPRHEWGATVELSGKPSTEDLKVRLQPCGKALARFVGPDGAPIAGHQPSFEFVATPGPSRYTRMQGKADELTGDSELMANVDRKHYWHSSPTDNDGRITLPSLIPGAIYRILDFSTVRDPKVGVQVAREFTVKPGETLDLGDVRIEKPEGR